MPVQTSHTILGGRVQLFQRPGSAVWHCSASVGKKQRRKTTGEDSFARAKKVAEDWYLGLRGKLHAGILDTETTFEEASKEFLKNYRLKTESSDRWVEGHEMRLRLYLVPFFGEMGVSKIEENELEDYLLWRSVNSVRGRPPSRSTLHDEIVLLRLVLKFCKRKRWLKYVPELKLPYGKSHKVVLRPRFDENEYRILYEGSRENAKNPPQPQLKWEAEQLHDFILFMANTGLRPDEAAERNLLHQDIEIINDPETRERILHIKVRGKRGVGWCKSTPGAVEPYLRLLNRPKKALMQTRRARYRRGEDVSLPAPVIPPQLPKPTDPVFPGSHIRMFNSLLDRLDLKFDREGQRRVVYSLRHTYICMRLEADADIYQVAKNCRTSVEMIQKHYAVHLKNTLNAAQINRMRPRSWRKANAKSVEAPTLKAPHPTALPATPKTETTPPPRPSKPRPKPNPQSGPSPES